MARCWNRKHFTAPTQLSIQMSNPLREHPHVNIKSSGHNPLPWKHKEQILWESGCSKAIALQGYPFTVSTTLARRLSPPLQSTDSPMGQKLLFCTHCFHTLSALTFWWADIWQVELCGWDWIVNNNERSFVFETIKPDRLGFLLTTLSTWQS